MKARASLKVEPSLEEKGQREGTEKGGEYCRASATRGYIERKKSRIAQEADERIKGSTD